MIGLVLTKLKSRDHLYKYSASPKTLKDAEGLCIYSRPSQNHYPRPCMCISLCRSVLLPASVYAYLSLPLYLAICVRVCVSVSAALSASVFVYLSLPLCLRPCEYLAQNLVGRRAETRGVHLGEIISEVIDLHDALQ